MTRNFKSISCILSLCGLVSLSACNTSSRPNGQQDGAEGQDTGTLSSADTPAARDEDEEGFVQIFDGQTLDGWEGDTSLWRAENGSLVGEITPGNSLENNSFIIWQGGEPADFEFKAGFRISESGNSGVNYRSELLEDIPNALKGYQADIDGAARYTGQNYEEKGRTTLAYRGQKVTIPDAEGASKGNAWTAAEVTGSLGDTDSLKTGVKLNDWNEIHIIAKGNLLQHYVNGILMSEVTDNDTKHRKLSGKLGVQVHVGPPMKVEYRNIRLKTIE